MPFPCTRPFFSLLLTLTIALVNCARAEVIAPPTRAIRTPEQAVFTLGWTHRLMPAIVPYRNRANPIQGSTPELDIENSRVFVGSADHHIYCLDAQSGEVQWRQNVGAAVRSQALFMPETQVIFIGNDDGKMLALGAADGEERWSFSTEGEIVHQPVLDGEALYFSSADNTIHALDWTNGEQIWRYHRDTNGSEFEVSGFAGVAISDGVLFSGFSDGSTVALDAYDGSELWIRDLAEDIVVRSRIGGMPVMRDVDTTPVIGKRRVYVASYEAGVFALERSSGVIAWREPTKSIIALSGRGSTLYAAQAGRGVLAIDTSNGRVLWRRRLGLAIYYRPRVFQDLLIVPDSQQGLTALRRQDGAVIQRYPIGAGASGNTELVGSTAFMLSNGGTMTALSLH